MPANRLAIAGYSIRPAEAGVAQLRSDHRLLRQHISDEKPGGHFRPLSQPEGARYLELVDRIKASSNVWAL